MNNGMIRVVAAGVAIVGAVSVSTTAASAGSRPTAAPTLRAAVARTDASFLRGNEQVNLAEITIGKLAMQRAHNPAVLRLAKQTMADHRKAMKLNKAVARKIGVTLPSQPSAMQRKLAAQLMKSSTFGVDYLVAQIAGHKMSIAATRDELAHGSSESVVSYAKVYLPYARMHLRMAAADLKGHRAHQH